MGSGRREDPGEAPPRPPADLQYLLDLAEAIQEVFWVTTPARDRMLYLSPGYERVWQRPVAAIYADVREWATAIHRDDLAHIAEVGARIGTADVTEVHYRIVRPSGELRWIHDKAFPIRDAAGTVLRIAGVAVDVTEQRALEEQLRQTQKLESIGLFAGGIAHDFNNILGVISTNAGVLRERLGTADRELTDELEAAVIRGSWMTRQLLAFSRKEIASPVALDVNATVDGARQLLRRMIGEAITLRVALDPDVRLIHIDPHHLLQVILNLAVNARDAMPGGGELRIETRQADGEVEVQVTDSGSGMTPEIQARIFEPFFTTKGIGKGSGLGLPVVHGIVTQAAGRLEVDSEPGRGTTFRLRFPALRPVDPRRTTRRLPRAAEGTILLVDDDRHVRNATARALRGRGYGVLEAEDAAAVLPVLGTSTQRLDLLITDIVMPGMNGHRLAEHARAVRPTLPVLLISGFTADEAMRRDVLHRRLAFLEKPFRVQDLDDCIRRLLDEAQPAPP